MSTIEVKRLNREHLGTVFAFGQFEGERLTGEAVIGTLVSVTHDTASPRTAFTLKVLSEEVIFAVSPEDKLIFWDHD